LDRSEEPTDLAGYIDLDVVFLLVHHVDVVGALVEATDDLGAELLEHLVGDFVAVGAGGVLQLVEGPIAGVAGISFTLTLAEALRSMPAASLATTPIPHSPARSKFSPAVNTPLGVTGHARNTASTVSIGPSCPPFGVRKKVDTTTEASVSGPESASITPNTTRLLPTARSLDAKASLRDSGAGAGTAVGAAAEEPHAVNERMVTHQNTKRRRGKGANRRLIRLESSSAELMASIVAKGHCPRLDNGSIAKLTCIVSTLLIQYCI